MLMIRDGSDVQLDNVARTVMANNKADCHIALHWDSTKTDKGAFYMSVPNNAAYRAMEPVASHWEEPEAIMNLGSPFAPTAFRVMVRVPMDAPTLPLTSASLSEKEMVFSGLIVLKVKYRVRQGEALSTLFTL